MTLERGVPDGVLVLGDSKIDRGRSDGRMPEPDPGSSNLAPGLTIKKTNPDLESRFDMKEPA
jgi:hypothetical protein